MLLVTLESVDCVNDGGFVILGGVANAIARAKGSSNLLDAERKIFPRINAGVQLGLLNPLDPENLMPLSRCDYGNGIVSFEEMVEWGHAHKPPMKFIFKSEIVPPASVQAPQTMPATQAAPAVTVSASANDSERRAKLNAMRDRMNDPAFRRDLELVEVESGRREKAHERYAKWDEIGDGGTSVGLYLKETQLGDAKKERDELEALHKVMRGDVFPEPQAAPVVAESASGGVEPVTGKRWTPEKLAELKSYREKHGTKNAAKFFRISQQLIRQKLPSEKPQTKGYSVFMRHIK